MVQETHNLSFLFEPMISSAFPTPNCTNIAEEERIEAIKSKILSCGDSFGGD